MIALSTYQSLILDCDGVILDSNRLKTEAFAAVAARYVDRPKVDQLVEHHRANGGQSRFTKFAWMLAELLPNSTVKASTLIAEYGALVTQWLSDAAETPGLRPLLAAASALGMQIYVASGGLESEVVAALTSKKLEPYFHGIYGSPRNKYEIVEGLQSAGKLPGRGLFIGDSRYDMDVARHFSLTPLFMAHFTEWDAGSAYCKAEGILQIQTLADLPLSLGAGS